MHRHDLECPVGIALLSIALAGGWLLWKMGGTCCVQASVDGAIGKGLSVDREEVVVHCNPLG